MTSGQFIFELSVAVHGATRASARLSRAPVSVTPETLGKTGFYGEFFSPATTVRRPAVLIIGGSQGGPAAAAATRS